MEGSSSKALRIAAFTVIFNVCLNYAVDPNDTCIFPAGSSDTLQCRCHILNPLKVWPQYPEITPSITIFIFQHCEFAEIANVPYANAESLEVIGDHILHIKDNAFANLNKLELLLLNDNLIRNITRSTFTGLTSLERLVMQRNKLTRLADDAFSLLKNIKLVDLSGNDGLVLPRNSFRENAKLESLSLASCNLDHVPEAAKGLPSLKELMLDGNSLRTISQNAFTGLPNLQVLSLNRCALKGIPAYAFNGLSQLTFLNIGYNGLADLNEDAFKVFRKSLKRLWLENNQFERLDEDVLDWRTLNEVRLGHNPWQCVCENHWMYKLRHTHYDPENVTCDSPNMFKGHNLYNITAQLHCQYRVDSKAKVILAVALPLVLCTPLIAFFVWRYMKARRNSPRGIVRYTGVNT